MATKKKTPVKRPVAKQSAPKKPTQAKAPGADEPKFTQRVPADHTGIVFQDGEGRTFYVAPYDLTPGKWAVARMDEQGNTDYFTEISPADDRQTAYKRLFRYAVDHNLTRVQ